MFGIFRAPREAQGGYRVAGTTGTGFHRSGPGECLFLEGEVRVKVDLRSFHLLMTEPEGYDREVYPSI
jgi:hypothetical protein